MNRESEEQKTNTEEDKKNYSTEFDSIINRRRSNRKFDTSIKIPSEIVQASIQRAILSPNSSNMQLWEFYWIKSDDMKAKFHQFCLGQNAAKTADQFVVFVTRKDLWKKRARWNADRIRATVDGEENRIQKLGLQYYTKLMPLVYSSDFSGFFTLVRRSLGFFMGLVKPFYRTGGVADQRVVVHKSCALAAQTFMLSIAAEGYDSCPMEGFDSLRVKRALDLPRGAEVCMIIAIGKGTQAGIYGPRFRVPFEEVVFVR
jgi:nitroreductase